MLNAEKPSWSKAWKTKQQKNAWTSKETISLINKNKSMSWESVKVDLLADSSLNNATSKETKEQ